LVVKLKSASPDKVKPCFENWKNLTQEQRMELKGKALEKSKEFHVIEDTTSSDSSSEKKPMKVMWKKASHLALEKIRANPELAKNEEALIEVFKGVKGDMKDIWKQYAKKHGKGHWDKKGAWGDDLWKTFKILCEKYPEVPEWKIGKIMKKNIKKSVSEIAA